MSTATAVGHEYVFTPDFKLYLQRTSPGVYNACRQQGIDHGVLERRGRRTLLILTQLDLSRVGFPDRFDFDQLEHDSACKVFEFDVLDEHMLDILLGRRMLAG